MSFVPPGRPLPPPIRRIPGRGFANYTVTHRFPAILESVVQTNTVGTDIQVQAARRMLTDIVHNRAIDTTCFEQPTDYWERSLAEFEGQTWNQLSFFDIEFLFYHGLNSIFGYFKNGADIFEAQRDLALEDALPRLRPAQRSARPVGHELVGIVKRCLWGNEFDYSQTQKSRASASPRPPSSLPGQGTSSSATLLVDETSLLASKIAMGPKRIDLIADNAGTELVHDLLLADAAIGCGTELFVVHVKPWPIFVSDAMASDVDKSILALQTDCNSESLQRAGDRLAEAKDDGRLRTEVCDDWGEPRSFANLSVKLTTRLHYSDLIISKGDLNYRRFVDDRSWLAETSSIEASRGVPFEAYALRVLKSDAVVGLDPNRVHQLNLQQPNWRTNSRNAVVQRLGNDRSAHNGPHYG